MTIMIAMLMIMMFLIPEEIRSPNLFSLCFTSRISHLPGFGSRLGVPGSTASKGDFFEAYGEHFVGLKPHL